MIGNVSPTQTLCIDTNALVGGSQPHCPQNPWRLGIGTNANWSAPETRAPTAINVISSFLKIISILGSDRFASSPLNSGPLTKTMLPY